MSLYRSICLSLAAGLTGLVASSAAIADDNFYARSTGGLLISQPDPPVIMGNLELFVFLQEGPVTFEHLLMHFEQTVQNPGPDTVVGTFLYIGEDQADTFSGTYQGTSLVNADGTWTGVGMWSGDQGTGAFTGLVGHGTYTTAFLIDEGTASAAFDGMLVPAPASGALLALALVGTRRRRSPAI